MRTLRTSSMCLAFVLMLAASPALAQGVGHFVSVGGPDQDATNHTDANFSLVAIAAFCAAPSWSIVIPGRLRSTM